MTSLFYRRLLKFRRRESWPGAGFTLIELLVVITILGILAGIVVFSVGGLGDKGKANAIATDARTLQTAEEAYCAIYGSYASMAQLLSPPPRPDGQARGPFLAGPSTYNDVEPGAGDRCGKGAFSSYVVVPKATLQSAVNEPGPSGIAQPGGTIGVGQGPVAEVVNPATNMVYVEDYAANTLTAFNGADNSSEEIRLTDGSYTTGLAGDGFNDTGFGLLAVNPVTDRLYVAEGHGVIEEFDVNPSDASYDTSLGTVSLPGGDSASEMLVDSSNGHNMVYILGQESNPVHLYAVSGAFETSPSVTPINLSGADFSQLVSNRDNAQGFASSNLQMMALNPGTDDLYVLIQLNDGASTSSPIVAVSLSDDHVVPIPVSCGNPDGPGTATGQSTCEFDMSAVAVDTSNNEVYVSGGAYGPSDANGFNNIFAYVWQINGAAAPAAQTATIGYEENTDNYGVPIDNFFVPYDDLATGLAVNPNSNKLYMVDGGGFGPGQDLNALDGQSNGAEVRVINATTTPICGGGDLAKCTNMGMAIEELIPSGTTPGGTGSGEDYAPDDFGDPPVVNTFDDRVYERLVSATLPADIAAVDEIDPDTNAVGNVSLPSGHGNTLVAVNTTTGFVYVINAGSDNITVLSP